MKLFTSRKAMVLYYIVVPGFGLALIYFLLLVSQQNSSPQLPGELPLYLLSASQRADTTLFSLDKAAQFAGYDALYFLAAHGGLVGNSKCASFFGYPVWDEQCMPSLLSNFQLLFQPRFQSIIRSNPSTGRFISFNNKFSTFPKVPYGDYAIFAQGDTLVGATAQPLDIQMYYTQSPPLKLPVGIYRVPSSFNTHISYNFERFDDLTTHASRLLTSHIDALSTTQTLLDSTFAQWDSRLLWKAEACIPENSSELFWDVAEAFQDCISVGQQTTNMLCTCPIARENLQLLGEKNTLIFTQQEHTISLQMKNKETGDIVESYSSSGSVRLGFHDPDEQFSLYDITQTNQLSLQWMGDKNVISFPSINKKGIVNPHSSIFRLTSENSDVIAFIPDRSQTTSYHAFPECPSPHKDTIRLCVDTGKVPLYNPHTKKIEDTSIRFGFALSFTS